MPEWLQQSGLLEAPIPLATMAARLGMAAAFGGVIAGIYRASHGRLARDARTLVGTLVLLTILLAMVTMVIGESVARAFGLVGALSIVRFRTVVEDTRDTAFVIFAVVVGMAVGTGLVLVAVAGVPIVGLAAIAMSARAHGAGRPAGAVIEAASTLTVRLGVGHAPAAVESLLSMRARSWRRLGVATARQGAAVDLAYAVELPEHGAAPTPATLVIELNALPGVQNVELRSAGNAE